MRAVLYARVSTPGQAKQDLSIPEQLERMHAYCKAGNHEVVREFEEAGKSAKDDRRPVFREMIEFVKDRANAIDAIVVIELDRFYRHLLEGETYYQELAAAGVTVISTTMPIVGGNPAFLAAWRQMQGVWAELERTQDGQRTIAGMLQNAKRGYFNGSVPPFGYRVSKFLDEGGRERRTLEIDPDEATTIRRMFSLYVNASGSRAGVKRVAETLNAEGRLFRGRQWDKQRVQERIAHPIYVGDYWYNKKDGRTQRLKPRSEWVAVAVEPIIDRELFDRAAAIREAHRPNRMPSRTVSSPLLLSGLLRCGRCGATMTLETGRTNRYYNCSTFLKRGKQACPGNRLRQDQIEPAVLRRMAGVVWCPRNIRKLAMYLIKLGMTSDDDERQAKTVQAKLEDVRRRIANVIDAIEEGKVDEGDLGNRLRELRSEEEKQVERLEQLKPVPAHVPYILRSRELRSELRQQLIEQFRQGGDDAQEKLRRVIKRIVADKRVISIELSPVGVLGQVNHGSVLVLRGTWLPLLDDFRNFFSSARCLEITRKFESVWPSR